MRIEAMVAALLVLAGPLAAAAQTPATPQLVNAISQPIWSPKSGQQLVFDVYRDGGKFGRHVVTFTRTGDTLTVASDIELKVNLGPLTVFHYVHQVTENYLAGALQTVKARTKKDGKWVDVAAEATAGGLNVVATAFKGMQPVDAVPSTHWNVAEMAQPAMFSTETGKMLPLKVTDRGVGRVKVGSGYVDARRYDVRSEIEATFWYDMTGRWVSCAFSSQGSDITYVLRDLPA